jgi:hypothetical protein
MLGLRERPQAGRLGALAAQRSEHAGHTLVCCGGAALLDVLALGEEERRVESGKKPTLIDTTSLLAERQSGVHYPA